MASVHKRLQQARMKFLELGEVKKTGWNDFSKYYYFELGDFLPKLMAICWEVGILGVISFDKEFASLTIYNLDDPADKIVITSPMSEVNLKAAHGVQNTGAVETYQRRYLWVTAFEIVEHDELDKTMGKTSTLQEMDDCQDYEKLKDIFAKAYGTTKEKDERKKLKDVYERNKRRLLINDEENA